MNHKSRKRPFSTVKTNSSFCDCIVSLQITVPRVDLLQLLRANTCVYVCVYSGQRTTLSGIISQESFAFCL